MRRSSSQTSSSGSNRPLEQEPTVKICIRFQDGDEQYYRVTRSSTAQELLKVYCRAKGMEYRSMVFLYEGKRLAVKKTIDKLGMVDEDQIDVAMIIKGENGSNGAPEKVHHHHHHHQPAGDNVVKLKVKCNKSKDGSETFFVTKRNAKIRRLLRSFCEHASLDYRSTRFVIDQRWFSHEKTPNQLGLQDNDQIDALLDGNGA